MENLLESNERTLDIFNSVCSGLASCLALVHADIREMMGNQNKDDKPRELQGANAQKESPVDGEQQLQLDTRTVTDDINRQTRLAMQYAKQLEVHLFKVEDLRAKYEMHLKMGRSRGSSTKTMTKEFIDNIERIETEFQSYMGSFLLNIEDIQGFARICQGDTFEINIKYGDSQKFKTKIRILKGNRQKFDHKQSVFKARIADVITIKAYECKGLGKKVLLGRKLCETRDLFTARSQLMTIGLTLTGSIKLNLVITWNPLHLTPKGLDTSHVSLPPTPVSSSTLSSLSSVRSSMNGVNAIATDNNTTLINIQANNNSGRKIRIDSPLSLQTSPTNMCPECTSPANVRCHQSNRPHPVSSPQDQPKIYQDADAIYNYHIPEPDYLTTGDLKY